MVWTVRLYTSNLMQIILGHFPDVIRNTVSNRVATRLKSVNRTIFIEMLNQASIHPAQAASRVHAEQRIKFAQRLNRKDHIERVEWFARIDMLRKHGRCWGHEE